jgi:hypothetical protein
VLAFGASAVPHRGLRATAPRVRGGRRSSAGGCRGLGGAALLAMLIPGPAEAAAPGARAAAGRVAVLPEGGPSSPSEGPYAVLPLLREGAVLQSAWITDPQMVDALALGETTPGPLISIGRVHRIPGRTSRSGSGSPRRCARGFWLFLPSFVLVLRRRALPRADHRLAGSAAVPRGRDRGRARADGGRRRSRWPGRRSSTPAAGLGHARARRRGLRVLVVGGRRVNVAYVVLAGGAVGLVRALVGRLSDGRGPVAVAP